MEETLIRGGNFFAAEKHPEVLVASKKVSAEGAGRFRMEAELTLRGTTHPVVIPFALELNGEHEGQMRGEFEFNRKDFGMTFNMVPCGCASPRLFRSLDRNLSVMLLVVVSQLGGFSLHPFMNDQDSVIDLRIQSNLEYTDLVENITNNLTALAGCDSNQAYFIEMAVREIVVNAIRHGNQLDLDKVVRVHYRFNSERFEVGILDEGGGFDFDHLPDPCNPENLMKSSGRGIFLVRSFMDEFSLARVPNQGTEVRFSKRLSCPLAPPVNEG